MRKIFLLMFIFASSCQTNPQGVLSSATALPASPTIIPTPTSPPLGAGFRYSTYGPWRDPGREYWGSVGEEMAQRFPDAVPETVWIVGNQGGKGTVLSFPGSTEKPYIFFSSKDNNEEALTLFDELGFKVWLQVEPGEADVEELIHLILNQYGHHPSVVGVGVDVEWFGSIGNPEGMTVSDEVAEAWLAAAREHNENYRLFLKHWLPEKMPPTMREGLLFVDDSQGFDSLEDMVAEFSTWGETFTPAPVAFQFGYGSDKIWWKEFEDPPAEIGDALVTAVPNLEGLYWVDFTVLDVFPPAD